MADQKAPSAPTCDQVLDACRKTVDSADLAISKQAETINMLDEQNHRLETALNQQDSELAAGRAWYRQPQFVAPAALLVGILAGVYAAGRK